MNQRIIPLLIKARKFLAKNGLEEVKWEKLSQEGISLKEMARHFNTPEDLVTTILQHEREAFENIFKEYNFTKYNAIDVLLLVSKEINENLFYINPSITKDLSNLFPNIYIKHTKERETFVKEKIQHNINNGINQGIYKQELDPNSTPNTVWSEILKLYDTESLSGDGFSFTSIIEKLLNTYIKYVANEDGLNFYRNRKQLYGVLGFGL
ncbi:MAG: hypothetical protein WBG43_08685 [Marinifilaceae bacterium]